MIASPKYSQSLYGGQGLNRYVVTLGPVRANICPKYLGLFNLFLREM